MEEPTSRSTMYGDVGLIGVAVFVALALIMATLGSPALSDATSAGSELHEQHDPDTGETAAPGGSDHATTNPGRSDGGHGSDTAHAGDTDHSDPGAAGDGPGGDGHDDTHAGQAHAQGDAGDGPSAATPSAAPRAASTHDDGHGGHEGTGHDDGAAADRGHGRNTDGDHGEHGGQGHEEHPDRETRDRDEHSEEGGDTHEGHGTEDDAQGTQGHGHEGHDTDDDAQGTQDDTHDGHGTDDDGHEGHDEGGDAHDHANMYAGCDDDHPETQRLVAEVQHSLEHLYGNVGTMIANGYIPYFDAQIPGAAATEGTGHWLNPEYIDNGVELDPTRPEAILTDEWHQPIGVMFIEDANDDDPRPVYVNEDGSECSPWHPHTDMPARFSWWFYRQVYDGAAYNDGEVMIPEVTPAMMHVWAVHNPHGVYAGHDYPPASSREGPLSRTPGGQPPATPIDDALPEGELPVGSEETCPQCPDEPDDAGESHQGHDDTGGHDDDGHAPEGDDESGDDHAGHDAMDDEDEGHADDHGEHGGDGAEGHDHENMYAGCADDHPETIALRSAVQDSLGGVYSDVAVLIATGYLPYPDAIIPGITHWIKPPLIYDPDVVMDPTQPESILTDAWNRPVGMMFIEHPDEPGPPVYVDGGVECYPWHPHTDRTATMGYSFLQAVYQQEFELVEETPAMMHVWAIDNPAGVYAGHDYPEPSNPPGPMPSYLKGSSIEDAANEPFEGDDFDPVLEGLYEVYGVLEETILGFND